jgi:hypothetical protein
MKKLSGIDFPDFWPYLEDYQSGPKPPLQTADMIDIAYDDELGVLCTKTGGELSVEEILGHYREIRQNTTYPRDLKVIIDCRSTRLAVKLDDVSRIVEAAKNALPKYTSLKEAILITAPYETVVATLFEQNARFKNYHFRLFNSKNAALRWLNAL